MNSNRENYKEIEILSDTKNLLYVENFLKEYFYNCSLNQRNYNKIYLCLSEAVINSIVHGNQNNPLKKVKIRAENDQLFLYLIISDEGNGFNTDILIDPTNKKNIKKEWGRGLHIIKSYTEEIKFLNDGRTIELKFDIRG